MGILSIISDKFLQTIGLGLGALLLFFSLRRSYIQRGERQAEARANQAVLRRIQKGYQNAKKINNISNDNIDRMLSDTNAEFK